MVGFFHGGSPPSACALRQWAAAEAQYHQPRHEWWPCRGGWYRCLEAMVGRGSWSDLNLMLPPRSKPQETNKSSQKYDKTIEISCFFCTVGPEFNIQLIFLTRMGLSVTWEKPLYSKSICNLGKTTLQIFTVNPSVNHHSPSFPLWYLPMCLTVCVNEYVP